MAKEKESIIFLREGDVNILKQKDIIHWLLVVLFFLSSLLTFVTSDVYETLRWFFPLLLLIKGLSETVGHKETINIKGKGTSYLVGIAFVDILTSFFLLYDVNYANVTYPMLLGLYMLVESTLGFFLLKETSQKQSVLTSYVLLLQLYGFLAGSVVILGQMFHKVSRLNVIGYYFFFYALAYLLLIWQKNNYGNRILAKVKRQE